MSAPYFLGLLWMAGAVGIIIVSAVEGATTPASYWFFLGAALFYFGVAHIVSAINKAAKK